ncbi:MAG: DUF4440 domain-containing protein [Alphaproteobacteria bacterium]|nr:DUF4440 domain-containing protein [Alphaproteobacteria bacterium]
MSDIHDAVLAEVEALHRFISAWFQGTEPNTTEGFDAGFSARLDPEFVNVQPAGRILTRDELLDPIRSGHGTNSAFEIEIRELVIHRIFGDGRFVMATYTELQHGAKNSHPPINAPLSSVLLQCAEGKDHFVWLHLHETRVPVPGKS